ncbi:hypothetical protein ABK040_003342 [Willaertia magna]
MMKSTRKPCTILLNNKKNVSLLKLVNQTTTIRNFSSTLFTDKSQTMIHKILQQYAPKDHGEVSSGDYLQITPHHILTHDNTSAVMLKFKAFFEETKLPMSFANPKQPVFALDHNIQDQSEANLKKYKNIESFAKQFGVQFYPAGRGIGHQVMLEEGYAFPLTFTTASDSHSNMYGGIGCLGTPVVRTDAAAIWATGSTWWQVPKITKVVLEGKLSEGVSGKDVIIALCGLFNKDEVLNHCVEFSGEGVENLTVDERLSIANMTTEWGALAGVFPVDKHTISYLMNLYKNKPELLQKLNNLENDLKNYLPDSDAKYAQTLRLDLSSIEPYISGPNDVKVVNNLTEIEKKQIKIHKAYIVSCVNSRVEDLHHAANVIRRSKNKKIAEGVELYISAASQLVLEKSKELGDWQLLVESGAIVLPSGCGPCIGLGTGLLQDGEVGISATNRNFKGRMGSRDSSCYLASPEVVMASALSGHICGPEYLNNHQKKPLYSIENDDSKGSTTISETKIIEGFPERIEGEVVFCHKDNLNTDGIYPGKYTYKENISPEEQAQVAMENYDPNFTKIAKKGSILVCGYNFGTGSSREQAATCLKYFGIPLIIGGSFSETYKRNATNNGFLCIEVPELVDDLRQKLGTSKETVLLENGKLSIDFKKSVMVLECDNKERKEYTFHPVGPVAQELIVLGGLENQVMSYLKKSSIN